jgi:hypothetical protein
MLLRGRPDRRSTLAGRSLPTTADSPGRIWQVLDHVAAQQRRSALATSQLWTLKGTVMDRFAPR